MNKLNRVAVVFGIITVIQNAINRIQRIREATARDFTKALPGEVAAGQPTKGDKQYHAEIEKGFCADIVFYCGAPGRTSELALALFEEGYETRPALYRGLVTHTGWYQGVRITIATSGMGVPSMKLILDELIRCGAKIVIRLGSCGSIIKGCEPGQAIIVDKARPWDGTSRQWIPRLRRWCVPGYKTTAHPLVVQSLQQAVRWLEQTGAIAPGMVHTGTELTVDDFTGPQGRPNLFGEIDWWFWLRHVLAMFFGLGACYSMEAAGLFAYARFQTKGLVWGGAANAVVADRWDGKFEPGAGNDLIGLIGFTTAVILARDETVAEFLRLPRPDFW